MNCSSNPVQCSNTVLILILGNNLYGSEICEILEGVNNGTKRMAYILMDKIHPTPVQNYLLQRDAPLKINNCLSELGVFGAYVRYLITNCLVCA